MALATQVTNRTKTQHLVNLTNPNDRTATTVDTAYLDYAVTDVQADFEIEAEVEYDDTEPMHVSVGVQGVIAKLLMYAESGGAGGTGEDAHTRWISRLRKLRSVTSRARVSPVTRSPLTPSDEQIDDEVVRPAFDRERFKRIAPGTSEGPTPFGE